VRTCIFLLFALAVAACGDDDGSTNIRNDASPDAPTADAGVCGTDFEYQVEVFDWADDVAVLASTGAPATVTLTEVGNPSNTASVAPNGRAILCLQTDGGQVRFESSAHRTRIEVVSFAAYEAFRTAEMAESYRVYLLDQADLDGLAAGDANPANGQVFLDVRGDNSIPVAIDGTADAPLIGAAPGSFTAGSTTTDTETVVVFRNATPATSVDLDISALCSPPTAIPVVAGTVTGALLSCFFE
jgi:hypothetical protein